ncbi:hypothetical protein INR49_007361 [Caranx melampygus]|nr:hypothetical protein INR49_007361 [Caranx melampygus]
METPSAQTFDVVLSLSTSCLIFQRLLVRSGALAVCLADVAQPCGAVQVVEASVAVHVSTVLVSCTQTVTCPAVGLTGLPASGGGGHRPTQ